MWGLGWAAAPGPRPPPPLTLCFPQVLGWRVAAAVAWSVLLLPVCTAAFVVLSGLDPFHPVRWISSRCSGLPRWGGGAGAGAGAVQCGGRGAMSRSRGGGGGAGAWDPPAEGLRGGEQVRGCVSAGRGARPCLPAFTFTLQICLWA